MSDDSQTASPYAGRWVARVRGRIVAQGGTPEQALHAAQSSRHKEKPEIIYMPAPFSHSPLIDKVRNALPNQDIYLVGGAVRDMLRNRLSHDLDFALPANGIALARKVANALEADFMILDAERDTGRVIFSEADGTRTFLDFATYRNGDTLDADLRARDFTMNAIAYDIHANTIIDPLNGASDLRAKIIRACSSTALQDDPVRILRAIRQAAAFDFRIEIETRKAMKAAAELLPNISPERQRDEVFKILEGPKPDSSIRALEMLGVFPYLMPELTAMKGVTQSLPHIYDVWEHTLSVLRHLEGILTALRIGYSAEETNDMFTGLLTLRLGRFREQVAAHFTESLNADRSVLSALFFAALYHDVQKPATRTVDEAGRIRFFDHENKGAEVAANRARTFNLSNDEVERIQKIILHHMRFHFFTSRIENDHQEPSRKAIYRYFRDAGEAGVDLVLLGLADLRGMCDHTLTQDHWVAALDVARILLENYWEKREQTIAPPRLLDGNDLMRELSLQPGRIIGQLLEAIREEQAIGKFETREQALVFANQWLKDEANLNNALSAEDSAGSKGEIMDKININGIELAYTRRGKGTPLVLLHGYPLDHHLWDEVVPLLKDTFDLIIPDLRGFGESTTVDTPYTMDDFASDIVGLLDQLGIQKAAIAGHSMGGYVALAFARIYPERMNGLALVSSQVLADPPDRKEGRYKSAADVAEKGISGVVETMTPKFTSNPQWQAFARKTMEAQQPAAYIGALKAMAERVDSTPLLSIIKYPVVVIHGDADGLIPIERAREVKAVLPETHLVEIKGAGHMPMCESPKETVQAFMMLS